MLHEYHLLLEAVGDYSVALVARRVHIREIVAYAVQLALVHYHAVAGVVETSVQERTS